MSYSLDSVWEDCYENSTVLKNKFNLRDEEQLDLFERNITSMTIAQTLVNVPFENVDFEFYKKLHLYVFSDIYDWAGKIRTVEISKKNTAFCPSNKIEENAERIFRGLYRNNYLKRFKSDDFIAEFTNLYCDLNYLHPFRDGNGRIQRLFLIMLLKSIDKTLDFSKIDKDMLMIATIKSVSGDVFMLRDIFRENIK